MTKDELGDYIDDKYAELDKKQFEITKLFKDWVELAFPQGMSSVSDTLKELLFDDFKVKLEDIINTSKHIENQSLRLKQMS